MRFLKHLGKGLIEKHIRCYAWALMPNHAHLLLSPADLPISELLHGLLTGYAKYFNDKYERAGHLFQNRYKSILCQKENYFLELIRYIHNNPVRAGLVKDLAELSEYPWSGHSTLLGIHKRKWQTCTEVLQLFGERKNEARREYLEFMKERLEEQRDDFEGGGVRRSQKGWKRTNPQDQESWAGDERILGDSSYVIETLQNAEEKLIESEYFEKNGWNLERLSAAVCEEYGIETEILKRKLCYHKAKEAKAIIAYLARKKLAIKSKEIAEYFGVGKSAISYLVKQGEKLCGKNKGTGYLNNVPVSL